MQNYIIEPNNEELYHYGVLGMKWGVRRGNVVEAYTKASKKLTRLNDRVVKAEAKARKRSAKAQDKAASWLASDKSIVRANKRARKASYKVHRAITKAKRWYDAMDKTFKDTPVSLSKEQIALGKSYTDKLNARAMVKY